MLYLENLNDGYWRNHDEHKQHYIGWIQIFNREAAINKRKGYNDLYLKCKKSAKDAKRNLQRVLTGDI
nr:MAG TPA: hypothetical protein [Caudoviricetes sp.]